MKIKNILLASILGLTLFLGACTLTPTTTASTAGTTATTSTGTTTTTTTGTTTTATTTQTTLRVFTLTELAVFNGNNGSTAYIAVNGTVYDVTGVAEWTNGWHKGMHLAGTDATAAFGDSPHSLAFLNQLDIVGTLVQP